MVNLLGEKIKHKTLGVGTVTSVEENHIIIEFSSKTSKFEYPMAFERFLIPVDTKIADAINTELNAAIEAEAKKRLRILQERLQKKHND